MIKPIIASNSSFVKSNSTMDNKIKNNKTTFSNTLNTFIGVPKAYIKITPSFKSEQNIQLQRAIENEIQKQKDLNDYLWAKSWDEKEALSVYYLKAFNEIRYREEIHYIFGIREKTRQKIREKFHNEFLKEKEKHDRIMSPENIAYYEKLQKDNIKIRFKTAAEIMNSTKGEINTKIAGYGDLKRNVSADFIHPVTQELLVGGENEVPNSMLLCGPTGCGKTVVAEAIANETFCKVDRVKTNTDPKEFINTLRLKIEDSYIYSQQKQKELYVFRNSDEYKNMSEEERDKKLKEIGSPRTVIIIDEFDRYFNPKTLEKELIQNNINAIKTMFDGCSQLPKEDRENAAGITFICTTNYPDRIPISQDINNKKMSVYGVQAPQGKDMVDVINFYIEKASELIKEQNEKTDKKLVVPHANDYKLDKLAKKYGPSLETGAFSNDAISAMVIKAAESYIDNPQFDFNMYLLREFHNNLKDIRPNKLKKYQEVLDKLELINEPDENKIDYNVAGRKEIVESEIKSLTKHGEEVLTKKQRLKLAELRAELDQLNNQN